MRTALYAQAAASLAMLGVIWMVQLVQYPGFLDVGPADFPAFHAAHSQRITLIVGPLMALEGITALWILVARPSGVPPWAALLGVGLLGVAVLTTMFVSVPLHGRIASAWDAEAIRRLVATNWIRTAAWTARGILSLWMLNAAR